MHLMIGSDKPMNGKALVELNKNIHSIAVFFCNSDFAYDVEIMEKNVRT